MGRSFFARVGRRLINKYIYLKKNYLLFSFRKLRSNNIHVADDFRIFCGDLGNDVTDEMLVRVFGKYPSFQKAKVVRDKRTNKTKGFGFVSFKDPQDFIKAMKEMNGKLFIYLFSYRLPMLDRNFFNYNGIFT